MVRKRKEVGPHRLEVGSSLKIMRWELEVP